MEFCQDHWDRLREAISKAGLSVFISETSAEATAKVMAEIGGEEQTVDNHDPLMSAHFAITNNVLEKLPDGAVMYIMQPRSTPEDPVGHPADEVTDRTWSRCPLCYINLAHELSCSGCSLPKENGFDWMIDRAVQDEVTFYKEQAN